MRSSPGWRATLTATLVGYARHMDADTWMRGACGQQRKAKMTSTAQLSEHVQIHTTDTNGRYMCRRPLCSADKVAVAKMGR